MIIRHQGSIGIDKETASRLQNSSRRIVDCDIDDRRRALIIYLSGAEIRFFRITAVARTLQFEFLTQRRNGYSGDDRGGLCSGNIPIRIKRAVGIASRQNARFVESRDLISVRYAVIHVGNILDFVYF